MRVSSQKGIVKKMLDDFARNEEVWTDPNILDVRYY